jgi:hypothetical protein
MTKSEVYKICDLWIEGFDALIEIIKEKQSKNQYCEEMDKMLNDSLYGDDSRAYIKQWVKDYVCGKLGINL